MSHSHPPEAVTQKFREWANLRFSLLWAYEGPVQPRALIGTYSSTDASCWLIRRGWVRLSAQGETLTARKNQWAFVAIPTRHQEFSPEAEILSLHFRLHWPGGIPVLKQPYTVIFNATEFPRLEHYGLSLVRRVKGNFPSIPFPSLPEQTCTLPNYLSVQNLLPGWLTAYLEAQAALGNAIQQPGQVDERILHGISELDHTPLAQPFSESALLKKAGLGRSQFNALFHATTGMSPHAYFETRRREEAEALIANTSLSLKEIGARLGFRYDSHFTIWFRRHFQETPSTYRNHIWNA